VHALSGACRSETGLVGQTPLGASSSSLNQRYSDGLHWKEDSADGVGELFVNGPLVCSISSKNTAYHGNVSRVNFGLAEIYNCGPTRVLCGDCAISKAHLEL